MPRSPFRPLRHRVEALLLRAVGAFAHALPFGGASACGGAVGRLAFGLLARRRRIAVENIRAALGDPVDGVPAEALARRAFVQLGRSFLEFLWLRGRPKEAWIGRVDLAGFEPITERAEQHRGAILVTGHYGNWELFGASLRASGYPMRYLLPPQLNAGSDAYLDAVRRSLGIDPVKIGFGMREALRALRGGDFLAMLIDQDARRIGLHVPFFGRPASTHTGAARLAVRAGCPIAVAFLERQPGGRFRSRMGAILEPRPGAEEEEEVRRLTSEMTALVEDAVRRRPDHWYWIHRRWKTPPLPTARAAAPTVA